MSVRPAARPPRLAVTASRPTARRRWRLCPAWRLLVAASLRRVGPDDLLACRCAGTGTATVWS